MTIDLTCDYCDGTFTRLVKDHKGNLARGRVSTYCSIVCSGAGMAEIRKSLRDAKTKSGVCEECTTSFERVPHSKKDQLRFCTARCVSHHTGKTRRKLCKDCKTNFKSTRSGYCEECSRRKQFTSKRLYSMENTLGELRSLYSISQYHAKIRGMSRSEYKLHLLPLECYHCGYTLHVDVCHVKAVKDFAPSSTLREVNSVSNLIALCRNHHWEFDNGHLLLDI